MKDKISLNIPTWLNQEAPVVAEKLLGCGLSFGGHSGIITETEAYRGADDPASHAYRGMTPRNSLMFKHPGTIYIYLVYGMYHCLNIICERNGTPAAILIRGFRLENGIHLNGPGKLCRHLGLSIKQNGTHLNTAAGIQLIERETIPTHGVTPRIGIKKSQEKLWRFVLTDIKSTQPG